MKKILSVVLSLLMIIGCLIFSVSAEDSKTSTNYRYDFKFAVSKLVYNRFSVITDTYIALPGLENTVVAGDNCNCMTPQGICVTDSLIFISAYCSVNKYKKELEDKIGFGNNEEKAEVLKEHSTHNSVIYIIDKESGEYIKNIVLSDSNHVGGLASDGENLYIAKSSDKQVSIISAEQINDILSDEAQSVSVDYESSFDCEVTASFVLYFENIIWVGVFDEKEDSLLVGFDYEKKKKITEIKIPSKANGGSFTEIDGEVCLNINSSYGRKNLSDIYLYSVKNYGKENMSVDLQDKFKAPPLVQNSAISDGRCYFIYESAATCYSQVDSFLGLKSTTCAIDRICIGDADKLFSWYSEENMFYLKISCLFDSISGLVKTIF